MLPITPHISYQTDEMTVFRNVSIQHTQIMWSCRFADAFPHVLTFLKINITLSTWNFTINKASVLIFSFTMHKDYTCSFPSSWQEQLQ